LILSMFSRKCISSSRHPSPRIPASKLFGWSKQSWSRTVSITHVTYRVCHTLEESAEISSTALFQPTQYSTTRHPTSYMHL
jgi:hypothetical protein